jgi:butyryl-CoA dehydrogenase
MANPLVSDAFAQFLLHEVLDVKALTALPAFSQHDVGTFDAWVATCRRLAREQLFPLYRTLDAEPPRFEGGRVLTHPKLPELWRALASSGVISATRPFEVGGAQLPLTVATVASAYLMAGNASAYAFAGLTAGAAHLLEDFGTPWLKETFLAAMYEGRFSGTMALTEPQAGSSLGDLTTRARPTADGSFRLQGAKIFISGGDQSLTENIVHLVLARIEGAPEGSKGISLFAVPRLRPEGAGWVPNDVSITGVIHKIGWRGVPSVAMAFGEADDCHGWLVGPEHQGLKCMFQMMNEARLMVGVNATATAMVAFHESLEYARVRRQGRTERSAEQVPLIEHVDVRRMLLEQKAITEGALCLLASCARYADLAEHSPDTDLRERSKQLLDLLTPVAKTFPAEAGFSSNALAVQIHGGYGYSSEYLPEAWLRDQKLNSIHEGTTGIQSMDLLARKVLGKGGAALMVLGEEVQATLTAATTVPSDEREALSVALGAVAQVAMTLGGRMAKGEVSGPLGAAVDFMELFSTVVIGWQWVKLSAATGGREDDFAQGLQHAARHWLLTHVTRMPALAEQLVRGVVPAAEMRDAWF